MTELTKAIAEGIVGDEVDEKFVEDVASRYRFQRRYLMRMLQEIQSRFGYLPRWALKKLSKLTGVPLAEVLNVATFYHQFKLEKPGYFRILVCMGTACHLRGNALNYEFLRRLLNIEEGKQTSPDGLFTVEKVRCFGCCSLAPVIMVVSRDDKYRRLYGYVDQQMLRRIIAEHRSMIKRFAGGGGV